MGRNANTLEFEAIVSILTTSYMALLRILNYIWNMVVLLHLLLLHYQMILIVLLNQFLPQVMPRKIRNDYLLIIFVLSIFGA